MPPLSPPENISWPPREELFGLHPVATKPERTIEMRTQDLAARMNKTSAAGQAVTQSIASAVLELSQLEIKDEGWFRCFRELKEIIKPEDSSSHNTPEHPAGAEWVLAEAIDITNKLLQLALRSYQREQLEPTTRSVLGKFQGSFAATMANRGLQLLLDLTDLSTFAANQIASIIVFIAPPAVDGSPKDAFADTLARYLNWRWGEKGRAVLNWLIQFLLYVSQEAHSRPAHAAPLLLQYEGAKEPLTLRLEAQVRSHGFSDVVLQFCWVEGGVEDYYLRLVDLTDLISWLIATLRKPPDDQIAFTKTLVKMPKPTGIVPSSFAGASSCCLAIKLLAESREGGSLTPNSEQETQQPDGVSWSQAFAGANVAMGFVVPSRPDMMCGVELPLSILTSLSDVEVAPLRYKDGYLFKGSNVALFPERAFPESSFLSEQGAPTCLQWHIFREKGSTLVLDSESKQSQRHLRPLKTTLSGSQFMDSVRNTKRHFLR
ncbi:hypothetical protein QBC34DRAFT_101686 [Podospora aff. communis PSN243]|uniref:TLDc domain-containing protein n=1 Tax=Podospora aff. communis PSN243 TaxID=3040156 RepID=A0AAV9GKF1_9PEZI|nr:hypothetical protein QBC34DRAFT_101686 [Podospora aff. communis PSN243]